MQDLVIVIPDLYLPEADAGVPERALSAGLDCATRFGDNAPLPDGWRPWLARWVGREDLAVAAPGAVASAAVAPAAVASGAGVWDAAAGSGPSVLGSAPPAEASNLSAWIATPLYLIAGLTTVHADRRSLLRLPAPDLARFAGDFAQSFPPSELVLKPASSGEFVMFSTNIPQALTTEPARALVADLNLALPTGPGAASLRRLGAELEMWLHAHPLNQLRQQRGELPVSTLWLWGGGELRALPQASAAATVSDIAYGTDPYLSGLWHLLGSSPLPLPDNLADTLANSRVARAVLVAEVTPLLRAHPEWTILEALAELDRRFLSPAIAGLRAGRIEHLTLLLNDRRFHLRRRAHLKFWRRRRPGLTGLH